jgi:hypothetical protein
MKLIKEVKTMDFIVNDEEDLDALKELKKTPNVMIVIEEAIVIWLTELNQAIVIAGDYRNLSKKDLNTLVVEYVANFYGVQLKWKLRVSKEGL